MKKNLKTNIKTKLKKHLFFFIGIIFGTLLTSTTVIAAIIYQSAEVGYSNSTSGFVGTDVQKALDELEGELDAATLSAGLQEFRLDLLEDDNVTLIQSYYYYYEPNMTWNELINSGTTSGSAFALDGTTVYHKATGRYVYSINSNGGYNVQSNTHTLSTQTYVMSEDLCCFDPDTLITIDFEGNTKKIKDIEVGDTIVVENIKTKEKHLTTVLKDASEHPKTFDFTEITLESGTKLKFNSYHPIYTTEGYKSVTNYNDYPTLEEGDYAVDSNNQKKKIIKIKRYRTEKPEMTYNLLIKGINEFYLEEEYAYIANNTLVHTGIAEYDDEDEWREKNRYKCTQQDVYKDFNYDNATEEELIKYLVELKVSNENAFNEYIKYYISADQYYRYAKVARTIKSKAKELSNINTIHYTTKNKNNKLK